MVQKRKTSTKEDIKEALIQLLSEEKFENISISKLCERAGINRGTFYLHYEDKYQMIDSLKSDIISQLYSFFEEERESPKKLMTANFHILRTKLFLEGNFQIPQKYALEIFLSSVEGIISLWIAGGAQEEPEELTDIILTTYNYDYLR